MKLLIFGLIIGLAAIALAKPLENDENNVERIEGDQTERDVFERKVPFIYGSPSALIDLIWGTKDQNPSQQTYPRTYPAQGQYPQYGQGQWPQYPAPQHSPVPQGYPAPQQPPVPQPNPYPYQNQQQYPPQYQNQYPVQQYNHI